MTEFNTKKTDKRIPIKIGLNQPYEVILGSLSDIGKYLLPFGKRKTMIVSDDIVSKLYLDKVSSSLKNSGFQVYSVAFENGEKSKNGQTYFNILNAMAENHFTREDIVVALGGGVVGDLGGFAAATFMRGIKVVQVPTSLLAAIDSSVGGKTGIDLPTGKNLVGAFCQPIVVLLDTRTLKTLPDNQWLNGLGEGLKYALLCGGEIFEILQKGLNTDNLQRFVELCVEYKRDIVQEDEKENGKRRLLNLGHTFGHAIEQLSNFEVPHGIAVVKGLYIIVKAAYRAQQIGEETFSCFCKLVEKYGFDISCNFCSNELLDTILNDKKMTGEGKINLVDFYNFGDCRVKSLSIKELREYIYEC